MEQHRAHLVVGATGMIGGALAQFLKLSSERVICAGRWHGEVDEGKIYLDLASDSSKWELPAVFKTVYICSGITRLEECRRDSIGSSRVNVEGTLNLIKIMIDMGAFIVFLSSNQVFDGTMAKVPAQHPQNPKNEYGRQKATVEKVLAQWPKQAAIVRLTKVVGPKSIFSEWAKSLLSGETIHPFKDMVVSPIPLTFVVNSLKLIGEKKLGGIYQISGEKDIRYSDAAFWIAMFLGIDQNLIQPWTTIDAGLELETNPANTTMDTERLRQELGLESPPIYCTMKRAAGEMINEKNL